MNSMGGDEARRDGRLRRVLRLVGRVVNHEDPALVADLLSHASRYILRSSLGLPPAVLLSGLLLWSASPHVGLAVWMCLALTAGSLHIALHLAHQRRSRHDSITTWTNIYVLFMVIGGVLGGTLPLLALPGDDRPEYQSLVALLMISFMVANTIYSAPLTRLFLAYQVPIASIVAVGFFVHGQTFTTMLAIVVLFAMFFSFGLHEQANSVAVAAVRFAHRNDALVDQLHDERHRISQANDELREANEQLVHQAGHDALTDLANRPVFTDHLERSLEQARKNDATVAVLFLDLDRFKLVNDSLGHAVGDQLLVAVADRMRECLRDEDVFARLGGDEFTILIPHIDDPRRAVRTGDRIREVLRAPFELEHREIRVTASIGIAVNTHPDDTPDDLLRHADAAMYRAKAHGRDRVEVFDDSLRSALARRLDEETELRNAFDSGQIVLWLQPEVDLHTGRIIGAEGLSRWIHPERGIVPAGEYVHIIEDAGLLHDLARVTGMAGTAARLALADVVEPEFRIRLNLSASQLSQLDLLESFINHLHTEGVAPSMMSVEVTETAVIGEIESARAWLAGAREAGITVSLDDFGTGYSSLSLLAQLPLDGVKIDLSFVREITTSVAARAIVAATVEMAAVLGIEVVAEGVETEEQADLLRQAGVRRAQGFLYSPAVPADVFRSWLVDGPPWVDRNLLAAHRV